jgi:hypothetical protein
MTDAIRDHIQRLRDEVQKRFDDGMRAIDSLEVSLVGPTGAGKSHIRAVAVARVAGGKSRVQTVLGAIRNDYKTIAQIADELDFPVVKIRAVLYSKSVKDTVSKRQIDNALAFKLKSGGGPTHVETNGNTSSSDHVLDLLKQHPEGLGRAAIIAGLKAKVTSKNTISSALYILKKSHRINLSDGRYRTA